MKQIKVLCLFDYNCFTGFASVSKNLMQNWKKQLGKDAQFDIVAINYFGEPYVEEDGTRIISAKLTDNQKDDFGRYTFLKSVLDNDYDVLFILQDLGVTIGLVPHLKKFKEEKKAANKPNFKSIFYFPVDSTLVPNLCVGLEFFDVLATYTEFGRKEVLIQRPDLKGKVKVVPHGTNTKDFFPTISDSFRKQYFGNNSDKFIVTNINRNQPRKDIPTTIFGFMEFKNEFNPNAFLYLHMNPKDPLGWDLKRVLQQTPLIEGVDYMFPSEEDYNKGASVEKLNQIYNASDCYITTATGEGWGLCVHPSTMITTESGVSVIPDIKIGDKVLSNDGKYHKVIDTTKRKVKSYIQMDCDYGYSISATHEHPFYSMNADGKVEWRKFDEIEKNDFLAIVKPTGDKKLLKRFDLSQFLEKKDGWIVEKDCVYHKNGYKPISDDFSYSKVIKKYGATKKTVENAFKSLKGQKIKSAVVDTLVAKMLKDGYVHNSKLSKVNRYIKVDDNILWFIGLYLADGSSEKGKRVEFSLNVTTKKDFADRVKNIASEYFGVKDVVIVKKGQRLQVRISSTAIAIFLSKICGDKALTKKIPSQFIGCEKSLMPLVNGYMNGDGHVNLKNDRISFTTISPSLAYQMQSILASNDIFLAIKSLPNRGFSKNTLYSCVIPTPHCRLYMDKVGMKGILYREGKRNHIPKFKETKSHFFVRVSSVKNISKTSEMYDLCVSGSHTFTGNGLMCHNTITEAMATLTPVVLPKHTSIGEIGGANGERCYFLEELSPDVHNIDNIIRFKCNIYEIGEVLSQVWKDKTSNALDQKLKLEKALKYVKTLDWHTIAKGFSDDIRRLG